MSSWWLTPSEYTATAARVEAINNRAARRGWTGRVELVGELQEREQRDPRTGRRWTEVGMRTTITGEAPCYGGWVFLAAVDALPTAQAEAAREAEAAGVQGAGVRTADRDGVTFVLRYAPGVEARPEDREHLAAGRCEHCGIRNARRYTYLVRHAATGEVRQVGSTCVQDFTGWAGRPVFVTVHEVSGVVDGMVGTGGAVAVPPIEVLAVAYAAVREWGWAPAGAVPPAAPTKEACMAYLYGTATSDVELRAHLQPRMDEASAAAAEILAALPAELDGSSDYEANLRAVLAAAWVEPHHVGLLASAVNAWDRLQGRKAREDAQPDRSQVAHRGAIKDRLTVTGTITRCQRVENGWGASLLIIVENADTVAKMFTTAAWAWTDDVDTGASVTITGTVKRHEVHQGVPQTVLTRVRRVDAA